MEGNSSVAIDRDPWSGWDEPRKELGLVIVE